jgi:serine/threonine-protein kinase
MATVFEALDLRHERQMAIKVLHEELGATLGPGRFITEIKTTARLQHPHILPLLDSGEVHGLLFYVMPFVTGETLRDRLTRDTQLPIDEALRFAREVADALGYAHGLGIVHRDINPENILLQGGHALLADFGIALAVQHAGGTRMTQTGLSLGTPQYMSPEQAMGKKGVNFHSDLYALGAVTYEMLAGEPPFTGASVQSIVAKLLTERPVPLTTLRDTIPLHVEHAVNTALAKLPADRHRSAAEFARLLGEVATSGAQPTVGPSGVRVAAPASRRRREVMLVLGNVAAAVAVAVAVSVVVLQSQEGESDHNVKRLRLELPELTNINPSQVGRTVGISPDGETIAYAGIAPDGSSQLYVRKWDALNATAVPGSTNGWEATFSPKGDSIAFLIPPHRVKVVPLAGGVSVVVADSGLYGMTDGINGLDWGVDGSLYVTAQAGAARVRPGENVLHRVSTLDATRGDFAHLYPRLLPNGKGALVTIAFDALFGNRPDSLVVAVVDLATGKTTPLLRGIRAQYASSGHIVYIRSDGVLMAAPFDQRRLAVTGPAVELRDTVMVNVPSGSMIADFSLSASGTLFYTKLGPVTYRAYWVDRVGTATVMRAELLGRHGNVTISPDGSRVAMSIDDDMWVVPFEQSPPLRLTTGAVAMGGKAAWAPDGHTVFTTGYRDAAFSTVMRVNVGEGSQPKEVRLGETRQVFGVASSPDGQWIIFRTDNQAVGAGDILGIRVGIDTVPRVVVASKFEDLGPAVSPDGNWLAYSSNESGRHEIFVVPFPETSAAKFQVSQDGGIEPRWARSGRELFYRNAKDKLVAVPVTLGSTFVKGASEELFDVSMYSAQTYNQSYDVSADGKRFLMMRIVGRPRPEPVVVFNFIEELKALVKNAKP